MSARTLHEALERGRPAQVTRLGSSADAIVTPPSAYPAGGFRLGGVPRFEVTGWVDPFPDDSHRIAFNEDQGRVRAWWLERDALDGIVNVREAAEDTDLSAWLVRVRLL